MEKSQTRRLTAAVGCLLLVLNIQVFGQRAYNNSHPAISRDGTKMVFVSDRDGNPEIYSAGITGKDITRLTKHAGDDSRAEFSPDGKQVVFDSNMDGDYEIYIMDADGNNRRQLTFNDVPDMFPRWSPDGSQLVFFSDRDGNREIYLMNPNGSDQVNLSKVPWRDGCPVWSPDGTRILFHSTRTGKLHFQLYTMNTSGTDLKRITYTEFPEELASWSPDGQSLVYYREHKERKRNAELYKLDLTTGTLEQLTVHSDFQEIGEYYPPSWFPDNEHIAFWAKDRGESYSKIRVMNIKSKKVRTMDLK